MNWICITINYFTRSLLKASMCRNDVVIVETQLLQRAGSRQGRKDGKLF